MRTTDREIVEVLARDVMGWTWLPEPQKWAYPHPEFQNTLQCVEKWNPLESWADAGMLAEALVKADVFIELHWARRSGTWACILSNVPIKGYATAPRAISFAAYQWAMRTAELQAVHNGERRPGGADGNE